MCITLCGIFFDKLDEQFGFSQILKVCLNFASSGKKLTHEEGVVVDKLMGPILEPLGAIHDSGVDQADGEVRATGGH